MIPRAHGDFIRLAIAADLFRSNATWGGLLNRLWMNIKPMRHGSMLSIVESVEHEGVRVSLRQMFADMVGVAEGKIELPEPSSLFTKVALQRMRGLDSAMRIARELGVNFLCGISLADVRSEVESLVTGFGPVERIFRATLQPEAFSCVVMGDAEHFAGLGAGEFQVRRKGAQEVRDELRRELRQR